jgi:hypothetical protein
MKLLREALSFKREDQMTSAGEDTTGQPDLGVTVWTSYSSLA